MRWNLTSKLRLLFKPITDSIDRSDQISDLNKNFNIFIMLSDGVVDLVHEIQTNYPLIRYKDMWATLSTKGNHKFGKKCTYLVRSILTHGEDYLFIYMIDSHRYTDLLSKYGHGNSFADKASMETLQMLDIILMKFYDELIEHIESFIINTETSFFVRDVEKDYRGTKNARRWDSKVTHYYIKPRQSYIYQTTHRPYKYTAPEQNYMFMGLPKPSRSTYHRNNNGILVQIMSKYLSNLKNQNWGSFLELRGELVNDLILLIKPEINRFRDVLSKAMFTYEDRVVVAQKKLDEKQAKAQPITNQDFIGTCNVCKQGVVEEESMTCPHCADIFHIKHFVESVKTTGKCPSNLCKKPVNQKYIDKLINTILN